MPNEDNKLYEWLAGSTASNSFETGRVEQPTQERTRDIFEDGLIQQESGGHQFDKKTGLPLVSKAGAVGRAQVMPSTGPEAAKLAGLPWDEKRYYGDPVYNTALGKAYFQEKLREFDGDESKALAAYNAGAGAVKSAMQAATRVGRPDDWLSFAPKETRAYVPAVLGRVYGAPSTPSYRDFDRRGYLVPVKESKSATVGDYAKELAASVMDSAGSILQMPGEVLAYAANKISGTEDYESKNLAKFLTDPLRGTMTEAGKEAKHDAEVQGSVLDLLSGDAKTPDTLGGWLMIGANGFGSLLTSFIPIAGQAGKLYQLQRGIQAAKTAGDVTKVAALTQEAAQVAKTMGRVSSVTGAAMTGGAAAEEARQNVTQLMSGMSHEDLLKQIPAYQQAFEATGDEQTARNAVINSAGRWAAGISAPFGAAGGYLGSKVIEDTLLKKGLTKLAGDAIPNRLARGTVAGGVGSLVEGGQETAEKVGGNIGENIGLGVDPLKDPLRNTAGDALGGALVGGPIGVASGLSSKPAPSGPLGRAADAGAPPGAPSGVPPGTPPQSNLDPIAQRAEAIIEDVRQNRLLDPLRDIGINGLTVSEFLTALNTARNTRAPTPYREAAINAVDQAMDWIRQGNMPGVNPEPGTDLATVPGQGGPTNPPNSVIVPGAPPGTEVSLPLWQEPKNAQDTQEDPANAGSSASGVPDSTTPKAPEAPPTPRKQVSAPNVPFTTGEKGTAQTAKRKAQLQAMVANGFETVEKREDGSFWLFNPKRNEEMQLQGPLDAAMANKSIQDYVKTAAAQTNTTPTQGQKEAGNYKKGTLNVNGFEIRVENPKGSTRSGVDPDGKAWSSTLAADYGYFSRTEGADGDQVDVYVGPKPQSDKVFVVDQINPKTGRFDEHKVLFGYNTIDEAREGYLANYQQGWRGLGDINEATPAQLKDWLKSGDTKQPWSQNVRPADSVLDNLRNPKKDAEAVQSLRAREQQRSGEGVSIELADDADVRTQAVNNFLDALAKLTGQRGIAVQWTGANAPDGAYDPATGRYFVNIDRPEMNVGSTVVHEFKHLSERYPGLAKLYDRMWDLVPEGARKTYWENYLAKGRQYENLSARDQAWLKNEMLADFMGQRFNDKAWLEDLSRQRPALFAEFVKDWVNFLSNLIDALKGALRKDKQRGIAEKDIDELMRGHIAQLEQMKAIAVEVATEWAQRNERMAQKAGVSESLRQAAEADVAYSKKEQEEPNEEDLQDELRAEQEVQSKAEAAARSYGGALNDEEINSMGLFFEDAYPEIEWKDPYAGTPDEGWELRAKIPGRSGFIQMTRALRQPTEVWQVDLPGTWLGLTKDTESSGYARREAAQEFAQRQVAAVNIKARGLDLSHELTQPQARKLANTWRELEGTAGLSRYRKPGRATQGLEQIAKEMGVTKLWDLNIERTVAPDNPASVTVRVGFTNKATSDVFAASLEEVRKGQDKWLVAHTTGLGRSGLGSAFYQMAAEYAARRSLVIRADSQLSGINTYRRTEQMLAAALRTGRSNVMTPADTQRIYGFKDNASSQEDHDRNVARMLLAGLRNAREALSFFDELSYDPKTAGFFDEKGSRDEDVRKFLAGVDARALGMSKSTIARALMTRDMVEGQFTKPDSFAEPVLYSARARADMEYDAVQAQYKDTPQWMKAPNGEPTNLTERQWVQVRTPLFKEWFGDWERFAGMPGGVWADGKGEVSKVVDQNGEPLVVYHGTGQGGFTEFRRPSGKGRGELGIFASDNWSLAASYVRRNRVKDIEGPSEDPTPGVYALFINLRKPNETDFEGANWDGSRNHQYVVEVDGEQQSTPEGKSFFDNEEDAAAFAQQFVDLSDENDEPMRYVHPADDHYESTDNVVDGARVLKKDGAVIRRVLDDGGGGSYDLEPSDVFVAFEPNQLKSADWNTGEFGRTDDDIQRSAKLDQTVEPVVLELEGWSGSTSQLSALARKVYRDELQGTEVPNASLGADIAFSAEGKGEGFGARGKLRNPVRAELVKVLRELVERAVHVATEPPRKDRADTSRAFHTLVAPLLANGQMLSAKITVREALRVPEGAAANKFYDVTALEIERGRSVYGPGSENSDPRPTPSAASGVSVTDLIAPFNIPGDEPGEPQRSARYQPKPDEIIEPQPTASMATGRDVSFEVVVDGQPATVVVDSGVAAADYQERMDAMQKLLRCMA